MSDSPNPKNALLTLEDVEEIERDLLRRTGKTTRVTLQPALEGQEPRPGRKKRISVPVDEVQRKAEPLVGPDSPSWLTSRLRVDLDQLVDDAFSRPPAPRAPVPAVDDIPVDIELEEPAEPPPEPTPEELEVGSVTDPSIELTEDMMEEATDEADAEVVRGAAPPPVPAHATGERRRITSNELSAASGSIESAPAPTPPPVPTEPAAVTVKGAEEEAVEEEAAEPVAEEAAAEEAVEEEAAAEEAAEPVAQEAAEEEAVEEEAAQEEEVAEETAEPEEEEAVHEPPTEVTDPDIQLSPEMLEAQKRAVAEYDAEEKAAAEAEPEAPAKQPAAPPPPSLPPVPEPRGKPVPLVDFSESSATLATSGPPPVPAAAEQRTPPPVPGGARSGAIDSDPKIPVPDHRAEPSVVVDGAEAAIAGPPPVPDRAKPAAAPPAVPGDVQPKPVEDTPPPIPSPKPAAEEAPTPAVSPPAIPKSHEKKKKKKKAKKFKKPWFENFFDDDYLRTLPYMTPQLTSKEATFIEKQLSVEPPAALLDVGCGYGRLAIEFALKKYVVTGVDTSLPLLIKAAEGSRVAGVEINFMHQDMREVAFDQEFNGAFCSMTSFGYFDEDDNRRVVENVFGALKPGGRFFLEVINRDFVLPDLPSRIWWEGDECVVMDEVEFNFLNSRIVSKRSVVFSDGRSVKHDMSIRAYCLHELGKMLHNSGFRVLSVTGNLSTENRFYGQHSPYLIIVSEKPVKSIK